MIIFYKCIFFCIYVIQNKKELLFIILIYVFINVQKSLLFDVIYLFIMMLLKYLFWNFGKWKKWYIGVSGYFWVVSIVYEYKG